MHKLVAASMFGLITPIISEESGTKKPNVVLIMADDLGYNDLSCYGHPRIKTPVLDCLAKHGIRLTGFYSGATICTPSRMALMTGTYPTRLGWTKGVVGHIMGTDFGLNPDALTMAEVFKAEGYQTAMAGKWHLGDRAPLRPHRQGFDHAYYINKSNNQTNELWRGDELLEKPYENRLLTEKFTQKAIDFIQVNNTKPFFLYVPYSAPHFPIEPHPDWKGKSDYGDVVEEMDARIGEILAILKKEGLEKNTLVIFMSDNGPEPLTKESTAKPYRGKKWSSLEGGTRVPCIVSWPGVIPAGLESNAMIAAIDLLLTLSAACGLDSGSLTKEILPIDGVNVWGTLLGEKLKHPRNELLYWHGEDGFEAIRVGDWKLFPDRRRAKLGGNEKGPALFHLSKDIKEKNDLSFLYPSRVKEMQELAERRLADLQANTIPLGQAKPADGPFKSFVGVAKFQIQKLFEGERNPNIVVAMNGTVVASWGDVEDNFALGKKGIRVRRSKDGGENWGPLITVTKPCWHGGGITVNELNGDILAFGEAQYPPAPITIYRSQDHGKTWRAIKGTKILKDKYGHQPSMHFAEHGITLRYGKHAGRLLRAARWYAGADRPENLPKMYNTAIYSDDGGTIWKTSDPFPALGSGEGAVAELSDGRIYYNSRRHWDPPSSTYDRSLRWSAWSDNGGESWKDLAITKVLPDGARGVTRPGSGCLGGLIRLPIHGKDILLFSNCDSSQNDRKDVSVWGSFDGGKTWPIKRRVYKGPSAYSSLAAGRPGTIGEGWIYILFEGGKLHRYEDGYFARFNLDWLLGGEKTDDGFLPDWLNRA